MMGFRRPYLLSFSFLCFFNFLSFLSFSSPTRPSHSRPHLTGWRTHLHMTEYGRLTFQARGQMYRHHTKVVFGLKADPRNRGLDHGFGDQAAFSRRVDARSGLGGTAGTRRHRQERQSVLWKAWIAVKARFSPSALTTGSAKTMPPRLLSGSFQKVGFDFSLSLYANQTAIFEGEL